MELCRIAVLEGHGFPALKKPYHHESSRTALSLIQKLRTAYQNGDIDEEDYEAGTRQFLAMLCGRNFLEPMLLPCAIPSRSEIDARARIVVDGFLGQISAG
ncbi:unnamed protein product [Phaeothamnion confervicola]